MLLHMEARLNIQTIISELKAERNRIDQAIASLEDLASHGAATGNRTSAPKATRKRGRLSAAGRKRLSEMMKKRWAERRKKAAKSS
jgi:hypothetical protein